MSLARELAEAAEVESGVSMAIYFQIHTAVDEGRFADAESLVAEFHQRAQPPLAQYRPGQ